MLLPPQSQVRTPQIMVTAARSMLSPAQATASTSPNPRPLRSLLRSRKHGAMTRGATWTSAPATRVMRLGPSGSSQSRLLTAIRLAVPLTSSPPIRREVLLGTLIAGLGLAPLVVAPLVVAP